MRSLRVVTSPHGLGSFRGRCRAAIEHSSARYQSAAIATGGSWSCRRRGSAGSGRSNQTADTLMQERSSPARRSLLRRTAVPYIRVIHVAFAASASGPLFPQSLLFCCNARTVEEGQELPIRL